MKCYGEQDHSEVKAMQEKGVSESQKGVLLSKCKLLRGLNIAFEWNVNG